MTVLKPNRGNKTFSSRLSRWVDRLLSFEFEVVHVAGRTLGMAAIKTKCGTRIYVLRIVLHSSYGTTIIPTALEFEKMKFENEFEKKNEKGKFLSTLY